MPVSDLTRIRDSDGFVLHFGGRPNEVDAYTFANSIVAISDALRELNSQVNQGQKIELRLEAVGPGSFRGKIRGVSGVISNALKWSTHNALLPLLMAFVYDHYIDDDTFEIQVEENQVVIIQGGDRTIIPRAAYEAAKSLPAPEKVHQSFSKAIETMEDDASIESFGLLINLDDEDPILSIPRDEWTRVRDARFEVESSPTERVIQETVVLFIVKVVFATSRRKWEFVWNGVKISAYVEDPVFIADLMQGNVKVGNGDSLECVLDIGQEHSPDEGVWLNTGYSVSKVIEYIPRPTSGGLFDDDAT
jgi:hypothetical protein